VTQRAHVLDDDGLDLLELALHGAVPPPAMKAEGGDVTFTDAENTPLAVYRPSDTGGTLEALRPFASHGGPAWDRALRRPPAAVRQALPGPVPCVVVDDVPTRADLDRVARDPALGGAKLLLAIPVARRAPGPGVVGAGGRTRAALAFADALHRQRPDREVIRVVVPWPAAAWTSGRGWDTPDLGTVMAAYGAAHVVELAGSRPAGERARIAELASVQEAAVRAVYPDASAEEVLRATAGSADQRGAVVLFTGLSGSGKSTIARALADALGDRGGRRVTLLDGDEVRQHLSAELGFDAVSRERNVERIGWVAALVASHGGIAVAAPIAPFAASRAKVRAMAEPHGPFLLVWVSTPLAVCEARDRKGLYARAREGGIAEFTGISSPYEPPEDADVVVDTAGTTVEAAVDAIVRALDERLAVAGRPGGATAARA
jgi:sulfate adenylyltransferase